MDTRELQRHLLAWQRLKSRAAILTNCYVANSRWESDVVKVLPSLYWVEYELKTTAADFKADFAKSTYKYEKTADGEHRRVTVTKHDYYTSDAVSIGIRPMPKPKQFYFVTLPHVVTAAAVP